MIIYLDTLALLYRSYYAIPDLQAKDGTPTGALFGLTNTLFRIIAQMEPTHVVACFDRPEQTLRQEAHESYKEHREAPEEDMIFQITAARDMLKSYGVHVVEQAGHEADDLLGTLALASAKRGEESIIVTCDGDLLQMTVHENVRVYFLKKGMHDFVLYDAPEVEKKNGYPAQHIVDYKALAGDSSDNIVGVPGIGAVFAKRLIAAFGTLDAIYRALDGGALPGAGFNERTARLLTEGRESAFVSRDLATIHTDVPVRAPYIRSKPWRERVVYADARATLEQYSFDSLINRLTTLVGAAEPEVAAAPSRTLSGDEEQLLQEAAVMMWVLDSTQTNAGAEAVYAQTETDNPTDAVRVLNEKLKQSGRLSVWETIERPLMPVIGRMEAAGIRFTTQAAGVLSKKYRRKIDLLTEKIYTLAGQTFNINSPKQLAEVLYTNLQLRPTGSAKTASGARTTKESALLSMQDSHPIVPLVLSYRHYEKLRSTYVDALPKFVGDDGRIHTTLQQNGTETGRLSSRDPNLQNIPADKGDGMEIRDLFRADDGWVLLSVDYSQIELRLAALLSQDKELLSIFASGGDVHQSTAARVFSVPESSVTDVQRYNAKAINFGILYGMGAQALKRSIGVSLTEADKFLVEYKEAFPGLFAYIDNVKRETAATGSVTTAFGRVRRIDGITSSLAFVRSQAERMAVNSVVQGTAADVIKLAMIAVDDLLTEHKDDARMLLQVHDDLLFEIRSDSVAAIAKKIVACMESIHPPDHTAIPLTVQVKQGRTWGSLS